MSVLLEVKSAAFVLPDTASAVRDGVVVFQDTDHQWYIAFDGNKLEPNRGWISLQWVAGEPHNVCTLSRKSDNTDRWSRQDEAIKATANALRTKTVFGTSGGEGPTAWIMLQ
ncbi:hypothetical protein HON52_00045 [Candidatus Uhrbacteria bacterium]|nr:hypothetical protein [Candidatus Uhrbacteria bacterium]